MEENPKVMLLVMGLAFSSLFFYIFVSGTGASPAEKTCSLVRAHTVKRISKKKIKRATANEMASLLLSFTLYSFFL
jgi:hypothetical protein